MRTASLYAFHPATKGLAWLPSRPTVSDFLRSSSAIVRASMKSLYMERTACWPRRRPESLAEHLSSLMKDEQLWQQLGSKEKNMLFRFAPQYIYDRWESLLLETSKCADSTQLQRISTLQREEGECMLVLNEILCRETPFTIYNWQVKKI